MQLAVIMPPASVFAASGNDVTNTFPFITGVSIKDVNGNDLGNNVDKSSEIHINYTWNIPDAVDVNSGDYYKMQLPAQINIAAPIDQPITDSNGAKVADMHIATNGLVTLTFTNYPSTHSKVSGSFYVDCHFNSSAIGTNNPVPINFTIPGQAQPFTVNVNFDQPNPSIQKNIVGGGYNPATDEITWQVTVNNENVNVNSASVVDTIAAGQKFVDTTAPAPSSVTINGVPADRTKYSYDSATGKFVYNFGDITTKQVITFKTSVHDDLAAKGQGTYNYSNTAALNYNDSGSPQSITSNTKTVPVTVNLISKTGKYNSSTKQIDWTITVNQSGRTINNAVVNDAIPAGLTLDTSTVKLNGVSKTAGTDYTIAGQNFTYNLGNITGQNIITFSTSVDQSIYNSNNSPTYNNTATLTGDGVAPGTSASKGVGVPTNIIQKQGSSYDASTGKITWTITVNSNKTNVAAGAVVTDNIPSGQAYAPNSAKLDGALINNDSTINNPQTTNTLKYTFASAFSDTHTIQFQTQVTDLTHYKANYSGTYSNPVNLTATGINENATGTQTVTSDVINKTGIGYDYSTRETTWQIVVNNNKMPITNAVITDAIPSGQQYVPGSASIDDGTQGFFNSDSSINSTGILKYTFTGTINKTYTITFKTKLTDLSIFNTSGDKTLNNTASITGNEIPANGDGDSTGSQTVKNSVITKTPTYTMGNSYIDWTVQTNANWSIPLAGATITDTLQDGLALDTDTVELYKAAVNSDGSLTQGTQVTLTGDNVKYNINTREFDFTFPQDAGSGAFILKFRTNVTKTGNYTNSVEFKGSGVDQSSTTTQSGVWFSQGGGTATGETAGIKVVKVDKDSSQPLSGAVFQLIDQYGNVKATSTATGSDGSATFDSLKYARNYFIKEITPPTGYKLDSTEYPFQINSDLNQGTSYDDPNGVFKFSSSDSSKNIVTYNYNDEIYKGSIQFYKTGPEGVLGGAVFTLYQNDGTTPVKDSSNNNINITATSGIGGIVQFSNIPFGKYKIKETTAPTGYTLNTQDISADLTGTTTVNGQSVPVIANGQPVNANPYIVSDTKITGSVKITKTDKDTGVPIPGAVIAIFDSNNVQVNQKTTGSDGTVQFDNLVYGNYYYKEISSPDAYVLDTTSHSFSIQTESTQVAPQLLSFTNTKVKGNIAFTKTGEDTDSSGLQGAVFGLYQTDGTTPVKDSSGNPVTAISGSDGKVQFNNVEYGSYAIKEVNPPAGYTPYIGTLSATIGKNDNTKTVNPTLNGTSITTISDTKIRGNIAFTKTGEDTDSSALQGAVFTLYQVDGTTVVKDSLGNPVTATSGTDGKVQFSNVKYGNYKIKETSAPTSYNVSEQVLSANISVNGDTVTPKDGSGNPVSSFADTKVKANIKINKLGADGTTPLAGAEFTLYDNSTGAVLKTQTTDGSGTTVFTNLEYGSYKVQETKAPTGYVISKDPPIVQTIASTSDNGKTYSFGISNVKITGTVEFKKTAEDGSSLKGSEFAIYDKADTLYLNPLQFVTSDDNGLVQFQNVVYGSYTIVETKAPDDSYVLSTTPLNATIGDNDDGQTINLNSVVNVKKKGTVNIKKTDVNGNVLQGAVFTLYDSKGNVSATATSGIDGIASFTNVVYGLYSVQETTAPTGYNVNNKVVPVNVTVDGMTYDLGSVSDTQITGGIKISKTDTSTSAPVPGATITVYNKDGSKVGSGVGGVTAADGTVEFDNLTYGDYYFVETNAPEGYLLNTDKHSFSIKDNGVILKDSLTDTRVTGGIKITKTDFSTSAPVPGATITVYNKDGSKVGSGVEGVTATDGTVEFDNLRYGDYYFVETNAPEGYLLNTDKHPFSIKDNGIILTDSLTDTRITGGIKITKTDASTSAPVPGATITVYNKDGSKVGSGVEGNTATDGTVEFDNLTYGDYYFVETNAPEGYLLNVDKHFFSIKDNGVILTDSLTDTRITGGIKITKTDASTSAPVPGATITVYNKDGSKVGSGVEGNTAADGTVEFDNLRYGDYYFLETNAPEGYLLNVDKHFFSIKDNGVILKDGLTDTIIRGNIQISKLDDSGKALSGAEFTLYDSKGNKVSAVSSDANGNVAFNNLVYGNYTVKETKAPEGYTLSKDTIAVFVSQNNATYSYKIDDVKIKGTIELQKIGEDGKPLQGAEFTVYQQLDTLFKNPLYVALSDVSGLVQFQNVVYGNYIIKETKAPESYNLSSQILTAAISEDGAVVKANPNNISDTKIRGTVNVKKTDANGNALKGAEFTLYDSTGKSVTTAVSGVDGIASFANVVYGNYTVKETAAPTGYNLNNKVIPVNVTENEKTYDLGSVSDTQITGGIKISKTDASTSAPVPGATITVYTKDGKQVGSGVEGVTAADGTVEFNNLTYGDYYFVETNAPEGYLLNTDKHPFSIKDNGVILKDTLTDEPISIQGTVVDNETGLPVKGSKVEVKKDFNGDGVIDFYYEMVTGDDGKYKIVVPKGNEVYDVLITKPGYKTFTSGTIEVNNNIANLDIKMNPEGEGPSSTDGNPDTGVNTNGNSNVSTNNNANSNSNTINQQSVQQKSTKTANSILPKTGGIIDTTVLMLIGIIAIAAGSVLMFVRKRNINE